MPPVKLLITTFVSLLAALNFLAVAELHFEPPPLTTEQFEAPFQVNQEIQKTFHTILSYGIIFVAPSSHHPDSTWTSISQCIFHLLKPNLASTHQVCAEFLEQVQEDDPELKRITLAYRCYKSENAYDYDLHTAAIDKVRQDPRNEKSYLIHFTPQEATNCRVSLLPEIDIEHYVAHLKERKSIIASATEGVTPLSKQVYERAFLNRVYFETMPYFTYLFQRNLLTLSQELEPIRACTAQTASNGYALVSQKCMSMLSFHMEMHEKLPNIVLALRCFWNNDTTQTMYDLQVVPIDELLMTKDEKYLIQFTPPQAEHCSIVWGDEYKEKHPYDWAEEHQKYMRSLTKKRFEGAFKERGYWNQFEATQALAWIWMPDLDTTEAILSPISSCRVFLARYNRALISEECFFTLKHIESALGDKLSKLENLVLAYRCYLLYNPKEYQLQTARIDEVIEENNLNFVYFKSTESQTCQPVWIEDRPAHEMFREAFSDDDENIFPHDEL